MITNKQDYRFYVKEDRKRYSFGFTDRIICSEEYVMFRYVKNLRRLEYLTNIRKNIFQKVEYLLVYWNYKRLSHKYNIRIGVNTCNSGLYIRHMGVIVQRRAKVGSRCTIDVGAVVGTKGQFDNIAIIGDNVEICAGAKIIGKVTIGDNVVISPNSVVIKDVPPDCTVCGVPAVVIKE